MGGFILLSLHSVTVAQILVSVGPYALKKRRCGDHRAVWDGRYLDGKREATTGVYYYQLTVDGERFTRKMIAQRQASSQP